MYQVILCEDNKIINNQVKELIAKSFLKHEKRYKFHEFNDVTKSLLSLVTKRVDHKIYILDIELPSGTGLDIARKIRDEGDWNSIIIVMSVHHELIHDVYKQRLMLLDFISKLDDWPKLLQKNLDYILSTAGAKQALIFESNRIMYRLSLKDILYIERDSVERKVVIHTKQLDYKVNINLNEIEKQLDDRFFKCSRGLVVNSRYIRKTNFRDGSITLINGQTVYGLAKDRAKELKAHVEFNYK